MHIQNVCSVRSVHASDYAVLFQLLARMDLEGHVIVSSRIVSIISDSLGITTKTFRNRISSLIKYDMIRRTGHKEYRINPTYFEKIVGDNSSQKRNNSLNNPNKTTLYRHFDKNGNLLYVGISKSAMQRLAQHAATSHWFEESGNITLTNFATREEAAEAEIEAIKTEKPRYNIAHSGLKDKSPRTTICCHFNRRAMAYHRSLIRDHPIAAQVLSLFIEHMDSQNAVAYRFVELGELTGYGRTSLSKAIKTLKDDGWIQVLKVGTENAYMVSREAFRIDRAKVAANSSFHAPLAVFESEHGESTKETHDNDQ